MGKTKELSFKISKENLKKIIDILKDISTINNRTLIKINEKDLLLYATIGEGGGVNAFKSFSFKTNDIINKNTELDETITFICKDTKNFFRNLQIMYNMDSEVSVKMFYDIIDEDYYSDRLEFKSDKKLKLNFYGDDPVNVNTQITIDDINKVSNIEDSLFSFKMTPEDFDGIKKLSTVGKENDILFMNTFERDDKYFVSIGETNWDLTLSEIDFDSTTMTTFPKKYFKTISVSTGESVRIYRFERFIMVRGENSTLLISIELS